MIKRRNFLIFSALLGASPYLDAVELRKLKKEFSKVEKIIYAVQIHMFPQTSKLPSAIDLPVTTFIYETMRHKSFDKDIREFVLEGAKELQDRTNGQFIQMDSQQKEKALREYEKTNYGSSWLSRIMTLTMEGMFSDPIYGANIREQGWRALNTMGGQPRPKKRYLDV